MVRMKIVVGNWKMNTTVQQGISLIWEITDGIDKMHTKAIVVIAPPFTHLKSFQPVIRNHSHVQLGAQNCHHQNEGAFTGEISASILKELGISFVITGHSERRQYFHETDELILEKLQTILQNNMIPILCVGESLSARKEGIHFEMVKNQLHNSLFKLSEEDVSNVVIAYEPVWAIGTGKNATAEQAQEMHLFIRNLILENFSDEISSDITILYGGSCNEKNAAEIFSQPDIDGGLIGGASLSASSFLQIIQCLP